MEGGHTREDNLLGRGLLRERGLDRGAQREGLISIWSYQSICVQKVQGYDAKQAHYTKNCVTDFDIHLYQLAVQGFKHEIKLFARHPSLLDPFCLVGEKSFPSLCPSQVTICN